MGGVERDDHLTTDRIFDSSDVVAFVFSAMCGNQPVLRASVGHGMLRFFAAA